MFPPVASAAVLINHPCGPRGGLVPGNSVPRYAAGGPVDGGRAIASFHFESGQSFRLSGPQDVVEHGQRRARAADQIRGRQAELVRGAAVGAVDRQQRVLG
jgi:hypothetical protein